MKSEQTAKLQGDQTVLGGSKGDQNKNDPPLRTVESIALPDKRGIRGIKTHSFAHTGALTRAHTPTHMRQGSDNDPPDPPPLCNPSEINALGRGIKIEMIPL